VAGQKGREGKIAKKPLAELGPGWEKFLLF